jgi:23S rRNA A2030 N6-methylase RlmJ
LDGYTKVELDLLPLAQFRDVPRETEAYTVLWYNADNNSVLNEWANKTTAIISQDLTEVEVEIKFSSKQIRVDTNGVLVHKEKFEVKQCGKKTVSPTRRLS